MGHLHVATPYADILRQMEVLHTGFTVAELQTVARHRRPSRTSGDAAALREGIFDELVWHPIGCQSYAVTSS